MATVLFVDDEEALRRAVRAALGRRGHIVHTARSIARAIRCFELYEIDGVFVDVWLGDESGFDLLSWLQNHRPRVTNHVVFVTGDVSFSAADNRKLRGLGLVVLGKPFAIEDLDALALSWTVGASSSSAAAHPPPSS
jgi:DNA-binding NtrC family response regulator